jgi:hypothetical protein
MTFPFPIMTGGHSVAGNDTFLQIITDASLTTNLKLCLDMGDSACTDHSSQTFTDLSSASTDFHNGADTGSSTDDASFVGSAGGLSSADYISFDGGDFIECKTKPTFMDNFHKNNAVFSIATWQYLPGTNSRLYIQNGLNANDHGFRMTSQGQSTGKVGLVISKGSAGNPLSKLSDAGVVKDDAWNFVAMSITEATGSGGGFFYTGNADRSGYAQVSSTDTFDSTYTSPSSSVATNDTNIGADGTHTSYSPAGTFFGGVFMWEATALSKANFDTLFNAMKGRFDIA